MIESITLSGIATYSPVTSETIQNLKAVNYFYGANGAGMNWPNDFGHFNRAL
jgi:hypothetical protein